MVPIARRALVRRLAGLAPLLALAACVGTAYPPPPATLRRYEISSDVLFDFGSATLKPGAAAALSDILAQIRATYPYPAIRVEGHTDSIGSDAANDLLSERRAEAVRQWLMASGIPPQAITTVGYGKRRPIAPNTFPNGADNPDGRRQNRRVELIATPA